MKRISTVAALALALVLAAEHACSTPALQLDPATIATGRFEYLTALQAGETRMEIPFVRTIHAQSLDGVEILAIETTSVTGIGETVDRLHLDARSLKPIAREITQGEGRLHLNFNAELVSGEIESSGTTIKVDLVLDQPAYAGDAGLDTLLVGLDLSEGLSGQVQVIETDVEAYLQRFDFSVQAIETVTVPAGTFTAWPIRLQAVDDPDYRQTLWISTGLPRLFVQAQAPVPSPAGGGHVLTQLLNHEASSTSDR